MPDFMKNECVVHPGLGLTSTFDSKCIGRGLKRTLVTLPRKLYASSQTLATRLPPSLTLRRTINRALHQNYSPCLALKSKTYQGIACRTDVVKLKNGKFTCAQHNFFLFRGYYGHSSRQDLEFASINAHATEVFKYDFISLMRSTFLLRERVAVRAKDSDLLGFYQSRGSPIDFSHGDSGTNLICTNNHPRRQQDPHTTMPPRPWRRIHEIHARSKQETQGTCRRR